MFVGSLVATSSVSPSTPTGTMLLRSMKSGSSFLKACLSTSSGVRRRNSRPLTFALASRMSLAPTSPSLSSHVVGSIPGRPIDSRRSRPYCSSVIFPSSSRTSARSRTCVQLVGSGEYRSHSPRTSLVVRVDRDGGRRVRTHPVRPRRAPALCLWDAIGSVTLFRQLQYNFHFFRWRRVSGGSSIRRPGQLDGAAADLDDLEPFDRRLPAAESGR